MAILSIQSHVAMGHVGNRSALLALERLGHEVWAVPTVLFSNHPAHGGYRGRPLPPAEVTELVDGLAERGVLARCEAVLSGYLGEAGTGEVIREAVSRVRAARPGALFCCDPVIGEVGHGSYVRPGVAEAIAGRLVPVADLCTPNPFELALLTGRPETSLSALAGARSAAEALRGRGCGTVVATGLTLDGLPGRVAVLAVAPTGAWLAHTPHRRVVAYGAGDLFAALLVGTYVPARDLPVALGHAVSAMDTVLAATEALGPEAGGLRLVATQDALRAPSFRVTVERLP